MGNSRLQTPSTGITNPYGRTNDRAQREIVEPRNEIRHILTRILDGYVFTVCLSSGVDDPSSLWWNVNNLPARILQIRGISQGGYLWTRVPFEHESYNESPFGGGVNSPAIFLGERKTPPTDIYKLRI